MIKLNEYISGNSTNGYFAFLGYLDRVDPTNVIHPNHPNNRGILEPNGSNATCFGLESLFNDVSFAEDSFSPVVSWVDNPANPYDNSALALKGTKYTYSAEVDFVNLPNGYYGFMYIDGDVNLSTVNDSVECANITCFEIEVINSFENLETVDINLCTGDITNDDINLETLLTDFSVFNANNYVSGGMFIQTSGPPLGILNPSTGLITNVIPEDGALYSFKYILTGADYPTYHDLDDDGSCILQEGVIMFNIAPFEVGNDANAYVCNNCIVNVFDILQSQNTEIIDITGTWADLDSSGATIDIHTIDFNGVAAGTYEFEYSIDGTSSCASTVSVFITVVDPPTNPGDQFHCTTDSDNVYIFTVGAQVGLIPFILGNQYQVLISSDGINFTTLVGMFYIPGSMDAGTYTIKVCIEMYQGNVIATECECCIEFDIVIELGNSAGSDIILAVCNN